jgi:hypothetical protein
VGYWTDDPGDQGEFERDRREVMDAHMPQTITTIDLSSEDIHAWCCCEKDTQDA